MIVDLRLFWYKDEVEGVLVCPLFVKRRDPVPCVVWFFNQKVCFVVFRRHVWTKRRSWSGIFDKVRIELSNDDKQRLLEKLDYIDDIDDLSDDMKKNLKEDIESEMAEMLDKTDISTRNIFSQIFIFTDFQLCQLYILFITGTCSNCGFYQ